MSRRGASKWPDNTASQNMFLNIFLVITALQRRRSMDLIFASRRTIVNCLSVEWTPSRPKRVPTMLRKTMIVLARLPLSKHRPWNRRRLHVGATN